MRVKRSGKTIFGAELTSAEKKALNIEIKKQLAEYDQKHVCEIDAMILYVLYAEFGFSVEELRRYFEAYHKQIDGLINRYEMATDDDIWLCTRMLKEIGVDVEAWNKETA